jgi:ribonuclease HI
MSEEFDVILYTDGGCRGNPGGIGGWGFLAINPRTKQALERCGGEKDTTNNRMEMMAAIMALRSLKKDGTRVQLFSDSNYLIQAMNEWVDGWKARGWKRKEGPLKNVDLWQELDALRQRFVITWTWVKGHAGNRGNEHVDQLTNQAMDALREGETAIYENRFVWN